MNLSLVRFAYLDTCTMGLWHVADRIFCGLGEPWRPDPDGPGGQRREGKLRESCIPDGIYRMRPHVSARYPKDRYVWCLINEDLGVYPPGRSPSGQEWGRDAILVHAGTTTRDILGCELVGVERGVYEGLPAVFHSQLAIREMRDILGWDEHTLEIRPTRGTAEPLT